MLPETAKEAWTMTVAELNNMTAADFYAYWPWGLLIVSIIVSVIIQKLAGR